MTNLIFNWICGQSNESEIIKKAHINTTADSMRMWLDSKCDYYYGRPNTYKDDDCQIAELIANDLTTLNYSYNL